MFKKNSQKLSGLFLALVLQPQLLNTTALSVPLVSVVPTEGGITLLRSGNDNGFGTIENPWRTIKKPLIRCDLVIRCLSEEGIYRVGVLLNQWALRTLCPPLSRRFGG